MGREAVNYKLRDWLFSRQRFWGEPFPILHELDDDGQPTGLLRAVDPADLPVDLPHLDDYKPHGRPEPPLMKAPDDWLYPVIDGRRYLRETNTMPQWAGSCWYYLRFIDPQNDQCFVDPEKEKAWMPVDLYVGGAEHAVLHLLYARFWHKVLYDRGHVSTPEPFQRLVNQGMILGEMEYTGFQTEDGSWVSLRRTSARTPTASCIDKQTGAAGRRKCRSSPTQVEKQGDGVRAERAPGDPRRQPRLQDVEEPWQRGQSGRDRAATTAPTRCGLYEMFMGPLEATKPWSMAGVSGVAKFLDRVWRMIVDDRAESLVTARRCAGRRTGRRTESVLAPDDHGRDARPR